MKNTIKLISGSIFLLLLSLIPYFIIRYEIPLNNDTLSSLGSYISGIVSILNLCVFIYLTILISNYEKTKSDISNYEKTKSDREINTQKLIIQSQFRQAELEKIIEVIEEPFDLEGIPDIQKNIFRIARASGKLNSFLNQKQYLFPILRDQRYRKLGDLIIETFEDMLKLLQESDADLEAKMTNLIQKLEISKNEFIHSLQAFILIELER